MNKWTQKKMIKEYQGEIIHNVFNINSPPCWRGREKEVVALMASETKNE